MIVGPTFAERLAESHIAKATKILVADSAPPYTICEYNLNFPDKIKNKVNKFLHRLYNNLNFPNSYFVHRDYHVQNLIFRTFQIG